MPVTLDEVHSYSNRVKALTDKAVSELARDIASIDSSDPYTRAVAIRRNIAHYAEKYGMSAQELGAQWYEFCANKAGVNVDSAVVDEIDFSRIDSYFQEVIRPYEDGEMEWDEAQRRSLDAFENIMKGFTREPIIKNLDRDERNSRRRYRQTDRAAARAGYARVPVGETCAWCLMLASLGYYYRSELTALGPDPDHYHAHCDCIAVPYHGPDAIQGYEDEYEMYFDIYATARDDYRSGNYSDDTARRIEEAHAKHDELYASGVYTKPWTDYNAVLIVMRDEQGLKH